MDPLKFDATLDFALSTVNSWLVQHATHTSPFKGDTPAEIFFRRKCFNELCDYVVWQDSLGQLRANGSGALLDAALGQFRPDYSELASRSPRYSLMFSASTALAIKCRIFPSEVNAKLVALLSGKFSWNSELVPHRMLDLLVACHYAGAPMPVDPSKVIEVSALTLSPDAILTDRDGLYAFTHSAMYARVLKGRQLSEYAPALDDLEGAIYRTLADNDIDLALELTVSYLIIKGQLSAGGQSALARVIEELTRDGVVDGTHRPLSSVVKHFLEVKPDEKWAATFHLMTVVGLVLSYMKAHAIGPGEILGSAAQDELHAIGHALLHASHYRLLSAVRTLEKQECWSARCAPQAEKIVRFLRFNLNQQGGFGFFQPERNYFERSGRTGDFERDVLGDLNQECHAFLAKADRWAA